MLHQRVFLHAPRDRNPAALIGEATVLDVGFNHADSRFLLVELGAITKYDVPITLSELWDGESLRDFHQKSTGLWRLTDGELSQLRRFIDRDPRGFGDPAAEPEEEALPSETRFRLGRQKVRLRMLRVRMLELYGPKCPFTGEVHQSLDGRRFEVQLGHLYPLSLGGLDVLANTMPMSGLANWAWDEGLISLTNGGRILLAEGIAPDTAHRLSANRQIEFPKDPRSWPKAEFLEQHRNLVFGRGVLAAKALQNNNRI
jgi:hypothetical protein